MTLSFRIGAGMGTEVHLLAQQAVFLYVGYAPPPPCSDQIHPNTNLRKSLFWLTVREYSLQCWRRPGGEELEVTAHTGERWPLLLSSLPSFYSVWDRNPWNGAAHS